MEIHVKIVYLKNQFDHIGLHLIFLIAKLEAQ